MLLRLQEITLAFVFARVLGHGRRMEGYLTIVRCFGALMFLLAPNTTANSKVLLAFYWAGYDRYLFLPLLLSGILSAYGLVANIKSWGGSRTCRFFGAMIGFFIWVFFIMKSIAIGDLTTGGFVLGVPAAFYGELGTMIYSAANLPVPGAQGNLGQAAEAD